MTRSTRQTHWGDAFNREGMEFTLRITLQSDALARYED